MDEKEFPWIYLKISVVAFLAVIFSFLASSLGAETIGSILLYGGMFGVAIGVVLHIYFFLRMRSD